MDTRRLPIAEPETFKAVLNEVTARYKTQQLAAAALRVKQPVLSRAAHGVVPKYVTEAVFHRMARALRENVADSNLAERFEESVHTPDSSRRLARYWGWWMTWMGYYQEPGQRIESQLRQVPAYGALIDGFLAGARQTGEPGREMARARLALYRALAPLAAADDSAGVEVSWKELDRRGDLERFLHHSLKRELLLLGKERATDVRRALTASEREKTARKVRRSGAP